MRHLEQDKTVVEADEGLDGESIASVGACVEVLFGILKRDTGER